PVPERARQAEAVHEDDRAALARLLDVQLRTVDGDLHARLPTASTIDFTDGAYAASSDGVKGTGACGAVTRRTGPLRESNACSDTTAAISDATLQCGRASSAAPSAPDIST